MPDRDDGFLFAQLDEYMIDFDLAVDKMNEKFVADEERWRMYAAMDPKDINYSRMPKMISNLDHTLDSLKDLFNGSEFSYEDRASDFSGRSKKFLSCNTDEKIDQYQGIGLVQSLVKNYPGQDDEVSSAKASHASVYTRAASIQNL